VILTAVLFGTQPAIAAALAAFIMFNYYLEEPRFVLDFSLDDSVALLVFAGVATVTGGLTSRVRRECERAVDRANMADTLFHASRDLSAKWDEREIYRTRPSRCRGCRRASLRLDGESLLAVSISSSPMNAKNYFAAAGYDAV
jgi:two-component system, OmpR family, sensor histidine kinase KdpD